MTSANNISASAAAPARRRPMRLLAPAGGPEQLRQAMHFGADEVYLAGRSWGMRARSKNFDRDQLEQAIRLAHASGVAVHLTLNTLMRDCDIDALPDYLRFVDQNSNRTIDAGERAKLVFEIRNAGPTTVYNVTPVVGVTGTKKVMVSPTAIVASIAPGRSVRYTAELYGKPSLRRGMADFTISFAYGQYLYTVRSFQLQTGR